MATTMRDVAERAGVSVRTVSNVVNDFRYVADTTRSRVQAAVAELGYRPNVAARNLRGARSGIIALGIPQLSVPYFAELADLIIDEAARRSFTVVVEPTGGSADSERRLAVDRDSPLTYDGLIFSPLTLGAKELSARDPSLPTVILGERGTRRLFDHVGVNTVSAARAATQHLLDSGRGHVAAIGAQPRSLTNTARYRLRGYHRALQDYGMPAAEELVLPVEDFSRETGARAMTDLLHLTPRPDAVFCFSDLLALGALRAASVTGVRVPEDIAVMGFDDIQDSRYVTPTLSTVAPDKGAIARLAVERLVARIDGDETAPGHHEAPYTLLLRESTEPLEDR